MSSNVACTCHGMRPPSRLIIRRSRPASARMRSTFLPCRRKSATIVRGHTERTLGTCLMRQCRYLICDPILALLAFTSFFSPETSRSRRTWPDRPWAGGRKAASTVGSLMLPVRAHPGDRQLDPRADAELRVDVVQVQLGGAESNSEAKSDLLVLQAGCGERRNLVFAPGQLVSFHLALMVTRSQRKGDGRAT